MLAQLSCIIPDRAVGAHLLRSHVFEERRRGVLTTMESRPRVLGVSLGRVLSVASEARGSGLVAPLGGLFFCISAALVLVFGCLTHVRLLAASFHTNHVAGLCPPTGVGTVLSRAPDRLRGAPPPIRMAEVRAVPRRRPWLVCGVPGTRRRQCCRPATSRC